MWHARGLVSLHNFITRIMQFIIIIRFRAKRRVYRFYDVFVYREATRTILTRVTVPVANCIDLWHSIQIENCKIPVKKLVFDGFFS